MGGGTDRSDGDELTLGFVRLPKCSARAVGSPRNEPLEREIGPPFFRVVLGAHEPSAADLELEDRRARLPFLRWPEQTDARRLGVRVDMDGPTTLGNGTHAVGRDRQHRHAVG